MLQAEPYSERRKRGYPLKNPIRRILGLFGDEGRPNAYDLNLEAARIIMEREARRIRQLIKSLPIERFDYAISHIKPRSEASQKALDSTL